MSAYSTTPTNIDDGDILIEALKTMGYTATNCIGKPQPLVGYQGDYRTADGSGHTKDVSKAMKADVIIPRKQIGGASNDIGFVRGADGKYVAVLSGFDRGCGFNEQWLKTKVNPAYQDIRIHRVAQKMGVRVVTSGQRRPDGKIMYQFLKA